MRLVEQLKKHRKTIHIQRDCIAGVIVALVSIPISMGYAQIAGLPPVYGLYGSLFPILVFGLLTTSPQFVVGVDAMPAVMTGSLLAQFGIAAESEDALSLVPLISLLVAAWFLLFFLFKAGRIVKYISTPVMGGFISGVGLTIIMMQIPKLFGGSAGTGVLLDLILHIRTEASYFHPLSAILGFGTFFVILICRKVYPKIPMTVIMMFVGAGLQLFFDLDQMGVKMLPEVAAGLPKIVMPGFRFLLDHTGPLVLESLSIAAVIMAQTLLATGSYAMKYNDRINNNAELLAYGAMNAAAAFTGSCPINGSVSRSGIADSFGCRSQLMSLSAGFVMLLVLLFGTPFLKYLPVPVLTGIVMTALWGILDFSMLKKLWRTTKNEFIVFMIAFLGVLLFGTVYGVVIGIVLSFFDVAVAAVAPPASFVGRIPGYGNFYVLDRNSGALPIRHVLIYRFSGNLFFANIDKFQNDIENSMKEDTKVVVIDARGIGSVDITAAERMVIINRNLQARGIRFYITEHDGSLNDQLRLMGAEELLLSGVVRRTITLALRDAGLHKPYELEGDTGEKTRDLFAESDEKLAEFEWIFGSDAERMMEELADHAALELVEKPAQKEVEEEVLQGHGIHTTWGYVGLFDEDEFLDHLELSLAKMMRSRKLSRKEMEYFEKLIERRRRIGEERLVGLHPRAKEMMHQHRVNLRKHLREKNPEEFRHVEELRREMEKED